MLVGFLITLDVLVCFLLILVVLMQSGKGGVSGAFGIGGASQTLFGAGEAGNVLTRATWILGGSFLGLSLLIALLGGPGTGSQGTRQSILQPTARPAATAPSSSGSELPTGMPQGGSTPAGGGAPATLPTGTPAGTAAPGTVPPPATTPATGGN